MYPVYSVTNVSGSDPYPPYPPYPTFLLRHNGRLKSGDALLPKVEVGPEPTGILPLRHAWRFTRAGGHTSRSDSVSAATYHFPDGRSRIAGDRSTPDSRAGCTCCGDLPRFVKLIEKGLFDAQAMITATYPVHRVMDAFEAADKTQVGVASCSTDASVSAEAFHAPVPHTSWTRPHSDDGGRDHPRPVRELPEAERRVDCHR